MEEDVQEADKEMGMRDVPPLENWCLKRHRHNW